MAGRNEFGRMSYMLKLAAVGVVATVSAAIAAQAIMSLDQAQHGPDLRRADTVSPASPAAPDAGDIAGAAPAQGSTAEVVKGPDGHYWAEAMVNGSEVRFLVDTGASAVALTQTDAQRLGITPSPDAYTLSVTTANGQTRAAPVKLASVSVGGAQVQDVDALVIENGLQTSLLGMTYLGRLSQFEATRTALILRP